MLVTVAYLASPQGQELMADTGAYLYELSRSIRRHTTLVVAVWTAPLVQMNPEPEKKPTPAPVPFNDPTGPDNDDDNEGKKLYRTMQKGEDGLPVIGPTARTLGVRTEGKKLHIFPDSNGNVHPGIYGMSVAPDTPHNLPKHRKPRALGGTSPDPLWSISENQLGPDLRYHQDVPDHGTVQPSGRDTPLSDYEDALGATQEQWTEEDPNDW